ncbi:NAD(P)-binding domain-containing protein [Amycolatopsis arida]|uniref:NAD(P)-binding domain-containing protein n=1 Tax=Amycolatopsis arida TaxID=587909 RepID=UPI001066DC7C|nr:NAD(P)-binding domain-containing protein [Amycolatopsis arida]
MEQVDHTTDVVVIGAGQAGLSAAYHLRRTDTDFVVLDHAKGPGGAWQHRWPSLRMDQVHGIHDLPGMALDPAGGTAAGTALDSAGGASVDTAESDDSRPAAVVMAEYFDRYERAFELPVLRPVDVIAVRRGQDDRLLVETPTETWAARAVVNATGTWDRPHWPYYPGRETFAGRQLHTADYTGPAGFAGQHVIVVGGGTSAVQLLTEIATRGNPASTTWVTRRPPVFVDGPFTAEHGRAAVAEVDRRVRAGLPPQSVVRVTGLTLTPEVARARAAGLLDREPMFTRITPHSVVWADGTERPADVILWATGFRAALDHLAPLRLRAPGGGITMAGTRVVAEPRLHLVGYGPSASTVGANRAGRAAALEIRRLLESRPESAARTMGA